MPVDLVRDAAIDVLLRVYERGVHLDVSLDKTLRRKPISDRGRRFMTQLVYGTVRHTQLADYILAKLCTQPLQDLPLPILVVLRMAVFQSLFCHTVTPPAMVHTSVDLAKKRGHAGLARLTNAVLRKVPTSLDQVVLPDPVKERVHYLAVRYSLPLWLVERWDAEWGSEQTALLCAQTDGQAPVTVRANTTKVSAEQLIDLFLKSGITAGKTTDIPEEVTLVDEGAPHKTKWFQQGYFIVQDPASLLPVHLLEPQAGDRVLDLCAAPGGKTTHLLQRAPEAMVVAADLGLRRLWGIRENAERLELPAPRLVCEDGRQPGLPGGYFDRVLVDAPCSGMGTLRRHPELKYRITAETIDRMAVLQLELLRSAIGLCKNGGRVVYSVCTFTPQETEAVVHAVLAEGGVELEDGPELLSSWKIAPGQYRTMHNSPALDGFFLTRFRKLSSV
jgi:16S rRNA (cytosine967-C5)-methyltransferase